MIALTRQGARSRAAWPVLALAGLASCRATPPPTETVTVTVPVTQPTASPSTATTSSTADAAPVAAVAPLPRANPLLGVWHVTGCQTSPMDPAACAKGDIVFGAQRWTVSLHCCKREAAYSLVSVEPRKVTIVSEGETSEIVLDEDGSASWRPGHLGGRVGSLHFMRKAVP
jgi:hypothetical protein